MLETKDTILCFYQTNENSGLLKTATILGKASKQRQSKKHNQLGFKYIKKFKKERKQVSVHSGFHMGYKQQSLG